MPGWLHLSGPPSSSGWWVPAPASQLVRGGGREESEEKLLPWGHVIVTTLRGMASLLPPSRSPQTPLLADSNQTPYSEGRLGKQSSRLDQGDQEQITAWGNGGIMY